MNATELLNLIDGIYAAAADPQLWPKVAGDIQHAIGGHSANLVLEDTRHPHFNYIYSNGVSAEKVAYYEQNLIGQDSLTTIYERIPAGQAVLTQNVWDEQQLHNLSIYENFYEDLGYKYFNCGLFYRDDERRGWISIARSEQDSVFSTEEHQLMQTLVPHLQRAFMINLQMMQAQQVSHIGLDSLEHLSAATLLLSSKGKVVMHNRRAEPYLCYADAKTQSLGIRIPEPQANRKLHRVILGALHSEQPGFAAMVPFSEKGIRKTVLCFPWRASGAQMDWLGQSTDCILFILSPASDLPPAQQLQTTFDLSKAEVRVLHQLMEGHSVRETAELIFVSEATVRFHIRSLLRKTDSRNQAELLSRVLRLTSVAIG
ncbi:helix-turn-helix transcriptional regulator [Marinobacterium jannaschii]|uniref:helix-turn-helix transcriptional regulator n=1 Tax=Marinobacterium jannaschii TaxID=64970 RepID=UPI0004842BDF|nr:helix-turn-helix transcriptional regulator [Marinobacterium jannaschii]